IGFIFLHDENSTYDKNFIDAARAAQKSMGLSDDQVIFKVNVPESNDCYEAAADLADAGCDIVFADSFGHESFIKQAAAEFPDVVFCHATGTTAHTTKDLKNFYNAFASIYEGRYLVGVAAGLKLNEMIESGKITADQAKMGYVGAFPYAEVKSGYTSFYLGAKSVCPTVTMDVKFTSSWFDIAKEKEAANALIEGGCVLISQHADSEGAPKACEAAGVPNVAYNLDTRDWGPNTALVSSKINWQPYFEHIISSVKEGKPIEQDFCKGLKDGVVVTLGLNENVAAAGTAEKLEEVKAKLISGEIKVFDTSTFTVKGETLTEYKADVIDDGTFTPDTNVISDGYFHESEYRSAPYFDIDIDGITIK
ncbi:MAG: BMP family ABC transporter substrate-binding protein, partial [Clostridia bacterium]|nr:BMP family ABC transporter substrate-binding protein [Clostridia bacterium]